MRHRRTDTLLTPPFLLLCAATFFGAMSPNLFIVAPRYLRALGLDERHIGMVMGAFPLASLSCMPLWARVAERISGRAPIAVGLVICAAGCAAFGLAEATPGLMLARVLQGAGWSGVLVGSAFCTSQLAPPGRLAQALGAAGVLTLVAMAMGPLVGELLVREATWAWMFRTAAITSMAGALLAAGLPRLRAPRSTTGEVLAQPAPPAGAAVWRPLAAMLLVATGFGAVVSFLADHTSLVGGFSVTPFFDAYVAAAVLIRLFAGSLSDRVGRHPVLVPSFLGQAAALAGLAFLGAKWQLWPLGAIFGVTHGLYYPAMQALIIERVPAARRARAAASGNFAFSLGMAVSAFGCGVLAEISGYRAVYLAVAGASLSAMVLAAIDRPALKSPAP